MLVGIMRSSAVATDVGALTSSFKDNTMDISITYCIS